MLTWMRGRFGGGGVDVVKQVYERMLQMITVEVEDGY